MALRVLEDRSSVYWLNDMSYDITIKKKEDYAPANREKVIQFMKEHFRLSADSFSSASQCVLVDTDNIPYAMIYLAWRGDGEAKDDMNCIEVHIPAVSYERKRDDVFKVCAEIASYLGWIVFDEQEDRIIE
jgi:hypothetical protein